jgi:hypothetical protein
MAMLYTKDTYELPDEPYFGYMRGRYSKEEIQEIDAYAKRLNIEVIASIQALGHLEPILRWAAYRPVKDTDNVVLVDNPKTYELISKMLQFWSDALSSRRIHLGMDETHDLGRGRFLDLNGYERGWDIYNRHLAKVKGICDTFGLKPIIWSDMYFRFANVNQSYYDLSTVVPDDVKGAIPPGVQLSFWDYYHNDKNFYSAFLQKHRDLAGEPFMASGIWTWCRLWYDHETTERNAGACIDGCRDANVNELIFTMWGDDGGYSELDSAFAGIAWAADHAFNPAGDDGRRVAAVFKAVFGADYVRHLLASQIDFSHIDKDNPDNNYHLSAAATLWDDPLMGIYHREMLYFGKDFWQGIAIRYRGIEERLKDHADDRSAGDFGYFLHLLRVLIAKIEFRVRLQEVYRVRDKAALAELANQAADDMVPALEELILLYRRQWKRSYKSFGQEIMQIRLGGLIQRYREVARTITEFVNGEISAIEELENVTPGRGYGDTRYRMLATGGWFI